MTFINEISIKYFMFFCMLCMIAFCQSVLLKRDDDDDDDGQ